MKGLFTGGLAAVLLLGMAWIAFAAEGDFSGSQVFRNEFETAGVDVQIQQFVETDRGIEEAAEGLPVTPGETVSYIPRITNLKTDSYVRVKLELSSDSEEEGSQLENCFGEAAPGWVKAGDWYYCTEMLSQGQSIDLLKNIKIPEETDPGMKELRLHARVDAVQGKNFSPDFNSFQPWGSLEIQEAKRDHERGGSLGIAKAVKSPDFSYAREGVFECSTEDLFSNFDSFRPGDTCREKLTMKNDSASGMEVFFRTENEENDLLKEMKLSVFSKDRNVYSGTLASAELENYMKIADIPPGKAGQLSFEISMPTSADNRYSFLEDRVTWIIAVRNVDEAVKTGDSMSFLTLAVIIALTAMLLSLIVIISGKLRK